MLSWAITSFGNKFCLTKRSRLIKALDNRFYIKFMQLRIGLLLNNPKMIKELEIKNFTELRKKYTGIHVRLEISLNWLILHAIAQQPQQIFL